MTQGHDVQLMAALTAAATGAQASRTFQLGPKGTALVHVELSGTGTVVIEGRMDPSATMRALGVQLPTTGAFAATITASGVYILPAATVEMRANVSANSANCTVWVQA